MDGPTDRRPAARRNLRLFWLVVIAAPFAVWSVLMLVAWLSLPSAYT